MNQGNRADRILIGIALLILLLASGAYVFDDWMWGHGKKRGAPIGQITQQRGDVRLKYEDDLKWQRANSGEALAYNDAIYSGRGGEAQLQVGESHMVLTENTLVVLRRDTNVNFLNLHYGTLLGNIAKNDRVMIDTGSGKPILLTSAKASNIVLRKEGKHTRLEVTAGEVSVTENGKTTKLAKSNQYTMQEAAPAAAPKKAPTASLRLRALKPLKEQTIVGDVPYSLQFAWGWENNRAASPGETYVVEFANDAKFGHIHVQRHVKGSLETSLKANQSLSLYYRVRGPSGELSNVERVNFIAMDKPLVIKPIADSQYETSAHENAHVPFQFRKPMTATVWYQVSDAPEFQHILLNQNSAEVVAVRDLPLGRYYLRARSDFGGGHLSAWTEASHFDVVQKLEALPLDNLRLSEHVLIPNHNYPASLYQASPATVESYLHQHGFLQNHFASTKFDELTVRIQPGDDILTQRDHAWPRPKPGLYNYKIQANKAGFLPSEWSESKNLEIMDAPPHAVGQAQFAEPDAAGRRATTFAFTPLLFASSYDVEMARNPNFSDSHMFKVRKSELKVALTPGNYYWRARARDASGQLISAFSSTQKMAPVPDLPVPPPAPVLAEALPPEPEPERAPAAVNTVATQVGSNEMQKRPWQHNGWWAWIGTGENFVDYKQTLAGTAAIDSHNLRLGSEYVEAGFVGDSGLGGVLAYKNTPGSFETANIKNGGGEVPITPNTYRWTTTSIEAIAKRATSSLTSDRVAVYGMRVGFQQHQVPFLSLNADGTEIDLKNNQMTTASVGILGEWLGRRWKYYGLMRYQFPLSTKADGATEFSLQPKFAFDGSLGASYNITSQVKLGLFAYGQWHQMNFSYTDQYVHNTGFQSLFYSNIDLRLGFDF